MRGRVPIERGIVLAERVRARGSTRSEDAIGDARVAAWWAHNPSTRHPKLHAFPRGPWRTSGWAETLRAAAERGLDPAAVDASSNAAFFRRALRSASFSSCLPRVV